MKYVFDSGPLIDLFRHYYPKRFPSLWGKFNSLVASEEIVSVREVYQEISERKDALAEWAKEQKDGLFLPSSAEELRFVGTIFEVKHFQAMIHTRKRYKGTPVADPFVIARAKILTCAVVTTERFKDNAAGIPNVCKHFKIECINTEEFMQQENWSF